MRVQLEADGNVPFLGRRHVENRFARIEDRVDVQLVFLKRLDAAVDGARFVVELGEIQRRVRELRIVESKVKRFIPELMRVGTALSPLSLIDLQMGVNQS